MTKDDDQLIRFVIVRQAVRPGCDKGSWVSLGVAWGGSVACPPWPVWPGPSRQLRSHTWSLVGQALRLGPRPCIHAVALAVMAERTCAAQTRPSFLALTPRSAQREGSRGPGGEAGRKTEIYLTSKHGSN